VFLGANTGFPGVRSTTADASSFGPPASVNFSATPIADLPKRHFVFDGGGPTATVRAYSWGEDDAVTSFDWVATTPAATSWIASASPPPVPAIGIGYQFLFNGFAFEVFGQSGLHVYSGDQSLPPTFEWIASIPGGGSVFGDGTLGGGSELEMVFGRYNEAVANAALVIGNGNDSDNRSNALVVTEGGDLHLSGQAFKPGGGSFLNSSDARLKDVGQPFPTGLEALAALRPHHYRYREDNALGLPSENDYIGVLAQDVEAVIPDAVEFDRHGYRLVNNDIILWTMLNALKELREENCSLKQRVEQLEGGR
jgi:hypothetical protein